MYKNGLNGSALPATMAKSTLHDAGAEKAVLGSIIIDGGSIYEVSDYLKPLHFQWELHRALYSEMLSLAADGRPIDIVTLENRMGRRKEKPEGGWLVWLTGFIYDLPHSGFIDNYARIVEELAIRRQLIRAAEKIGRLALEDEPLENQIGKAEMEIFNVRNGRNYDGVKSPRDYAPVALAKIEERRNGEELPGLPSGLADLDRLLRGFKAPFPYILAGRPGMGKSALACVIAKHLAIDLDKRVLFFAVEMTEQQICERIVSGMTGISVTKIGDGDLSDREMVQVNEAFAKVYESHLFIDATSAITPGQIRARSVRIKAEYGLDMVIVDHIHEMTPDAAERRSDLEYGSIVRTLKDVGKMLGIPVLILAQLNRTLENRQDKHPKLADLRESGALEEVAYAVLFLYRDEYYNPDTTDRPNICELEIAKHRDGPTGVIDLFWHGKLTQFRNLQRQEIRL